MRKVLAGALIVTIVVLSAGPALALRDPFEPAVQPDTGAATTGEGGTVVETEPQMPTVESEQLATTGSRVGDWLVVALGLMTVGAAALYLVRLYGKPLTITPRR